MTAAEFEALLATQRPALRARTAAACRLVLVDGLTAYAAAKACGDMHQSILSRALARLRQPRCPTCGQRVRLEK